MVSAVRRAGGRRVRAGSAAECGGMRRSAECCDLFTPAALRLGGTEWPRFADLLSIELHRHATESVETAARAERRHVHASARIARGRAHGGECIRNSYRRSDYFQPSLSALGIPRAVSLVWVCIALSRFLRQRPASWLISVGGKTEYECITRRTFTTGRCRAAGSPMSTACLSNFRIGSPVLLVHSTACGCCVQWLQHPSHDPYSLDLIGSPHGSPPRSSTCIPPSLTITCQQKTDVDKNVLVRIYM